MNTPNKITDEPPHFVRDDGDRGGNMVDPSSYWRQFLFCSNGHCVCGCGLTADEATAKANMARDTHEKFLTSPARERIKTILSKYRANDYPLATDQGDLNRAFAELLGIQINYKT